MKASAWNGGGGSVFGVRVGAANRDQYFRPHWTEIEVEIDGQWHQFALTTGFWNKCPEFRDKGTPVIREWLRSHFTLNWPIGHPPRFQLQPMGGNRFRLVVEPDAAANNSETLFP